MQTTNLFIEIIVTGSGATLALGIFIYNLLGRYFNLDKVYDFFKGGENIAGTLILMLPFVYVAGIIVDKIADIVLSRKSRSYRKEFFTDEEESFKSRDLIYMYCEPLKQLYEFNRSKIRICRGWIINFPILIVAVNFALFGQFAAFIEGEGMSCFLLSFEISLILAVLCYITYLTWKGLMRNEFIQLKRQQLLIGDKHSTIKYEKEEITITTNQNSD